MLKTFFFRLTTIVLLTMPVVAGAQVCTTLGQNPSTAFPVCGTSSFHQANVPMCSSAKLFVPGCAASGGFYENKNPYWYKFTCFTAGTLGFEIIPLDLEDDYDWQLYDVTGLNPDEVYTNRDIVVSANWCATPGATGAAARGTNMVECSSDPRDNVNPFSKLINLVQGHNYILLVSHFNDSQSGYDLAFHEGTAVITDPADPHLLSVKPDCDGVQLRVKLNKKMKCNSVTATGSEFSISPAVANVTAAQPLNCNGAFDFDSVLLTLSNRIPAGNYSLLVNNGSDLTTVLDNCSKAIPVGETMAFEYINPLPIFADSVGAPGCAPTQLRLYFPKRISCATIAADGSDFRIIGPVPVTISSAGGNCVSGFTDVVLINLSAPISDRGSYVIELKPGSDGSVVVDECGLETPLQTIGFECSDTVSGRFDYSVIQGCKEDEISFSHDGLHQVDSWNWTFNGGAVVQTRTHTIRVPATSTNAVTLIVSNDRCTDSVAATIVVDNEVKAAFEMPSVMCPEDHLEVTNTSTGAVDVWSWQFERLVTSSQKDPDPVLFPTTNREAFYTIKLRAENLALGCADSIRKTLRVLANCYIAVPSAFTPNNDGINDFLFPNNAFKADNLEFKVFNRWGQLVFQSKEWTAKWDGNVNGLPQGSGVFVWFLKYTNRDTGQPVMQKGTTTLIR